MTDPFNLIAYFNARARRADENAANFTNDEIQMICEADAAHCRKVVAELTRLYARVAELEAQVASTCQSSVKTPVEGDTGNPREAVVVQCGDGWWLVRTRDKSYWLHACIGRWHQSVLPFNLESMGSFRTEAEARAALAKAPPPPEVGEPNQRE